MRLVSEPSEIVKRMCLACGVKTQRGLAQKLGILEHVVSNWIHRGQVPPRWIFQVGYKTGRSVEWLSTGEESGRSERLPATLTYDRVQESGAAYGAASDLVREVLRGLEALDPEARDAVRRCIAALSMADPEITRNLIGHLKLIEELFATRAKHKRSKATG